MAKPLNKKLLALLTALGCFAFFALAFALETAWPDSPMKTKVDDETNLGEFIKYLYEWGIALGGVATFIAFVIAGFQYITSIGNPQTMKDAIDRIKSAMFGLVLLLSAYVLLETINPELISFHLEPFNPKTADDYFQNCEVDGDSCPPDYECKPMGASNMGICWPKDYSGPACTEAWIWPDTNFQPTDSPTTISIGEVIEGTDNMPKSIKARYKDGTAMKNCDERTAPDPNDKDKTIIVGDKSGCGCVLRLYNENDGWLWSSCGDVIQDVPAYEADLTRWADRNVYCVELLAPGSDK
jgi:hypothetical protein